MNPNQFPPQQPHNPYSAAPQYQNPAYSQQTYQNSGPQYPVICWVMFPISLCFSLLRILFVALAILGYLMMRENPNAPAQFMMAIPEILTGIGIVFFGLIGNGLMLAKKEVGYYFGIGLVVFVVLSMIVAVVQGFLMTGELQAGTPEAIGTVVGICIAIAVRIGILAAYVAALYQFRKWSLQTQGK